MNLNHDHVDLITYTKRLADNSRSLMAKTGQEHAWDFHDLNTTADELDPNTLINFSSWDFKIPPKYSSPTLVVISSSIKAGIFGSIALLNRR